jgi:hypothetical protein
LRQKVLKAQANESADANLLDMLYRRLGIFIGKTRLNGKSIFHKQAVSIKFNKHLTLVRNQGAEVQILSPPINSFQPAIT